MNHTGLPRNRYVVLHIGTGPSSDQTANGDGLLVQDGEPFRLNDDIWIERLDESTATNIQRACEPEMFGIQKYIRDRHIYAFVMHAPGLQRRESYGPEVLRFVISLSRLVNPTSTGDRYCAEVLHFGTKDSMVLPIVYRGESLDVTLGPNSRDWLTRRDGEELRKLMPWTSTAKAMYPRVARAYWNHEYAMRSHLLDVRWMFVVEGLDALINTDSKNNYHQFRVRVKQIADFLKVVVSQDELTAAYKIRSKLVHTEKFLYGLDAELPRAEHNPLYETLELILREATRKALLDDTFGKSFASAAWVDTTWKL